MRMTQQQGRRRRPRVNDETWFDLRFSSKNPDRQARRPATSNQVQAKLGGACENPARTARWTIKTSSRAGGARGSVPARSTRPTTGGVTDSKAGAAAAQNVQQMSLVAPEPDGSPAGGSAPPPAPCQITPTSNELA